MNLKSLLVKASAGVSGAALLATVVIGLAHTPWGRPLLRLPLLGALADHAGCPAGRIEPAAFEAVRRAKLHGEVGTAPARSHPGLAFTLGRTRRANVERWLEARRVGCRPGSVASVLECENVTAAGSVPISHLRLQFDGEERLVSVDLFRESADDRALVGHFRELERELDASVGPATSSVGTATLAFMKQSPLQTVVRSYGYRDYVASAMLLNLGKRGLRLREQYRWLAPPPAAG